jgi:hypothetical protein
MSILLPLLIAAQASAAPAPPARDQLGFDIQCMLASQSASEKVDGAMRAAAQLATMFYFGRVDSVLSGAALEQRVEAEAKGLEGRPLGPLLQQCGDFMQVRGKALEDLGAKLDAREQARQLQ